mgnify:CR=1 FL=1
MKRNFIIAAILLSAFTGVSCEKHRWTDKVEVIEETETDADGNVTVVRKTEVIAEKGAVRFFKEAGHGHGDHGHGDHGHGTPAHPEHKSDGSH